MKRIIYVAGSEGTGTRFIASIIGSLDSVDGHNAEKHEQDFDTVWDNLQNNRIDEAVEQFNQISDPDKHVLMRRSYPHGARPVWYNITNLKKLAEKTGRELQVIVTTRDINVLTLSLCRVDPNKNIKIASDRIKKAYDVIFTHLERNNIDYFIFSYETLMLLGYTYFKFVMDTIGLDVTLDPGQIKLRDGNRKYLNNEGLPVENTFEKVTVQPEEEFEYV